MIESTSEQREQLWCLCLLCLQLLQQQSLLGLGEDAVAGVGGEEDMFVAGEEVQSL